MPSAAVRESTLLFVAERCFTFMIAFQITKQTFCPHYFVSFHKVRFNFRSISINCKFFVLGFKHSYSIARPSHFSCSLSLPKIAKSAKIALSFFIVFFEIPPLFRNMTKTIKLMQFYQHFCCLKYHVSVTKLMFYYKI